MLRLVIKDILIQKKSFIYSILYAFFAITALTGSFTPRGAYMIGAMSIMYLFVMYANSYDDKNKCEIMLNSLPISRRDIVTAKYVSLALYAFFGIAITGIAGLVIKSSGLLSFGVRNINIDDIIIIIIAIGMMYSIYYPLYFKFGLLKLRVINILLYLSFLFVPNVMVSLIQNNPDNIVVQSFINIINNQPGYILQIGMLSLTLIVLFASFILSIKLYNKKEF